MKALILMGTWSTHGGNFPACLACLKVLLASFTCSHSNWPGRNTLEKHWKNIKTSHNPLSPLEDDPKSIKLVFSLGAIPPTSTNQHQPATAKRARCVSRASRIFWLNDNGKNGAPCVSGSSRSTLDGKGGHGRARDSGWWVVHAC